MTNCRACAYSRSARHTAAAAAAAGFLDGVAAGGNVRELAQCLRERDAAIRCSLRRPGSQPRLAADLATILPLISPLTARSSIPVVYRPSRRQIPPAIAARVAEQIEGVRLLASPAQPRSTAPTPPPCRSGLGAEHFCLSDQIRRNPWRQPAQRMRIAARPEESALIE